MMQAINWEEENGRKRALTCCKMLRLEALKKITTPLGSAKAEPIGGPWARLIIEVT